MRWFAVSVTFAAISWFTWEYIIPHKHLAPDGTFFLLQRVTKPTEFGIYSLGPGSEVHRIAQEGTKLTVSDGREQFEVDSSQLTNDLDKAADLQQMQGEERRSIHTAVEREKRRVQELQRQTNINHANATEQHEKARRETAKAPSALNRGAYDQKEDVARAPQIYQHHVDLGIPIPRGSSSNGPVYSDGLGRYWIDQNGGKHYFPPR
jgi:hypothetical protein